MSKPAASPEAHRSPGATAERIDEPEPVTSPLADPSRRIAEARYAAAAEADARIQREKARAEAARRQAERAFAADQARRRAAEEDKRRVEAERDRRRVEAERAEEEADRLDRPCVILGFCMHVAVQLLLYLACGLS